MISRSGYFIFECKHWIQLSRSKTAQTGRITDSAVISSPIWEGQTSRSRVNCGVTTVLSAQITIGITVTFLFHFLFSDKVLVLVSFFIFFDFHSEVDSAGKVLYSACFLFCCYHYFTPLRVFHTSVSSRFFQWSLSSDGICNNNNNNNNPRKNFLI